MPDTHDAIVIGTGIGGLTSGLALARAGRSVLLLESAKQFGGMLNPFARKKYHFDVGIHYVGESGEGQTMRKILDSLGLDDVRFREINPDCIDRYVFADYEVNLVKGIDRWGDILARDFPAEEANIRRFLELMKTCRRLSRAAMRGPGLGDVAAIARHGGDFVRLLHLPFSSLLERYFDEPRLRDAFAGPSGDIGVPPSRASSLQAIMLLVHYMGGAYYPIGGSGAIRDAYVRGLEEHGATLERNTLVETIEVLADGSFAVHTAKGERYQSRAVISNADAALTVDMLDGARPNLRTRRKVDKIRPSLGSFCVFLGTDIDVAAAGITDANIWHYGGDIESGYQTIYDGRIPDEPFFFLTAPTLKDPETVRAPAGHHTIELITFVPSDLFKPWFDSPPMKRGPAYDAIKAEITAKVLAGAERYIPGLGDHLIVEESGTPATVWHYVRGVDGGIYGPEATPDQSPPRRFGTSIGIPGLFLAGASIFGAGIMPCLMSGAVAGRACSRHLDQGANPRIVVPAAVQDVGKRISSWMRR